MEQAGCDVLTLEVRLPYQGSHAWVNYRPRLNTIKFDHTAAARQKQHKTDIQGRMSGSRFVVIFATPNGCLLMPAKPTLEERVVVVLLLSTCEGNLCEP